MLLQFVLDTGSSMFAFPAIDQSSILISLFKFLFILTALCYSVFAVIVVRQIQIMKNTLITSFSPIIFFVGFAHLLVALFVLGLFFVLL
ncbi:MAG: DUF5657 family protein [Patescibacteria group bacterium]